MPLLLAKQRPRLVVLGLDGLPFSLAQRLCQSPALPNLSRLVDGNPVLGPGRARAIDAELPEVSPVNWTSFYTAAGPEKHGVFGFTRMDRTTYAQSLVDGDIVALPSIFDRLAEQGLVSRVLNLPNTYPAKPLKGMLVAGFVAQDLARAVYPPMLAHKLTEIGYILEADTHLGLSDPEGLLRGLNQCLDSRLRAFDLLWPDLAWDLNVFVLTETDRLFHFLYHAVEDPGHELHPACMAFFKRWDAVLGEVLARYQALPQPKRLIVLADHGFTRLKTEVDLNAWLRQEGFLSLACPGPTESSPADPSLDSGRILPDTRAFALDPGRIYLHTRDRFDRSGLNPDQARALAPILAEKLKGLTWQGEPVMEGVFFARDLYPNMTPDIQLHAPDLVCLAKPGFDLKAKFDRDDVFGLFGRTGAHTARDAFFYDDQASDASVRVRDVGCEILRFFGAERIA